MAELGDVTVTLKAKDEVTPVLRRVGRQLWWLRHGEAVIAALWTLVVFVLGMLAATVIR